jgi:hypothetical protein
MFEVRWFEYETGKTTMNDHGFFYKETNRVLQYRYKYNQAVYSYSSNLGPSAEDRMEIVWSNWEDVPIVQETNYEQEQS